MIESNGARSLKTTSPSQQAHRETGLPIYRTMEIVLGA